MFDDAWLSDLLLDRGGRLSDAEVAQELAATLATHDPSVDGSGTATRALLDALDQTWERGWQPADVVHAARREATAGSVPLAVALIGEHARRSDAPSRAPDAWLDQLRELGALSPGDPAVVAAWHRAARRTPVEAWRIVLLLAGFLRTAARIDVLVPPPSRWGPPRTRSTVEPAAGDDRALRRIRGLLAKAESTEFPDEAEALTAKAQELMTRHAVDAALLDGGPTSSGSAAVGTRRVHVQDPYVRAKMQLLAAVAEANDVRLVWYQSLGIANLVGATVRHRRRRAAVHLAAAAGGPGADGGRAVVGSAIGVPLVPPLVPARLRAPDRRAARQRAGARHRRGCGRARRRPPPRAALAPGGGGGESRRALPARAGRPQPGVGRRGRLVRRSRRRRTGRRRTAPVVPALIVRVPAGTHGRRPAVLSVARPIVRT